MTTAEETVGLLEVEHLSVDFPGARESVKAVRDVSFTLRPGECLALVGESGSGKSATARALMGLAGSGAQVDATTLRYRGSDLLGFGARRWRALRGREIGMVLQDALTSLDPLRRVRAEVTEPLEVHGMLNRRQRAERVIELLGQAGIPDPRARAEQYPHELSGGLRQRALIATALAGEPSLLIADEPTTALDATVQAQVLELLADERDAGLAILLISHDLSVVARMADRIAVMYAGVIVEHGPTDQILGGPTHPYTASLLAAAPSFGGPARVLVPPTGSPLVTANSGTGCPYVTRCPSADARCAAALPDLVRTTPSSDVRCWHPLTTLARPRKAAIRRPPRELCDPIVEVEQITKHFRAMSGLVHTAVDRVSFVLHKGEALGIVGESGSGKSTTAQIVMGMLEPDNGSVMLEGSQWTGIPERQRRPLRERIRLIPQDPLSSFDPRFNVRRVIGEGLGGLQTRTRLSDHKRVVELLERVGLGEHLLDRYARELSGGERQRVAIARAIATDPDVLVCDEPVSALDVSVQAQLLDLFAALRADLGVALLFISHDLGVIHEVCDRVLVMKDGRVVESGEVIELFKAPRDPYTRELLDAARGSEPASEDDWSAVASPVR